MQPIQANLHWATDIRANLHNSALHFLMLQWEPTHNALLTIHSTMQHYAPILFGKIKNIYIYFQSSSEITITEFYQDSSGSRKRNGMDMMDMYRSHFSLVDEYFMVCCSESTLPLTISILAFVMLLYVSATAEAIMKWFYWRFKNNIWSQYSFITFMKNIPYLKFFFCSCQGVKAWFRPQWHTKSLQWSPY